MAGVLNGMMLAIGAGTLPTMLFVSIAFGKIGAKFRGMMLKSAALVMIVMGLNTFYIGLTFYVQENFMHRTIFHTPKEQIDKLIVSRNEWMNYITDVINSIQNM